jgi:hypothetical protein
VGFSKLQQVGLPRWRQAVVIGAPPFSAGDDSAHKSLQTGKGIPGLRRDDSLARCGDQHEFRNMRFSPLHRSVLKYIFAGMLQSICGRYRRQAKEAPLCA